ncbi:MAG: DUF3021 family protein [Bacilli bacterium]|nr:DUF3021 family protein [Bacilli bacterium]
MNKFLNKVFKICKSMLLTFLIVLPITMFVYVIVEHFIFEQNAVHFSYLFYITLIAAVFSVILNLFYRINRINSLVQIIITYFLIVIMMYSIGLISGWYNERLAAYILYGLLFNFIGVSVIATIVLLTRHLQFKKLNSDLEKYKEQLYNVSFKEDNKEEANDEEN